MNVIAIANQKGGTAKTTSVAALGILLSRRGVRVHLVDTDPQASLSQAFGVVDPEDRFGSSLIDRERLPVDILADNLSLTPGSIALSICENQMMTEPGREFFLRTSLEKTPLPRETIVLLDSPPSLGILAINCLAAAGGLIVVVQPGGFELHALAHLERTVQLIRRQTNPDLSVLGTILTNCHRRRKITRQVGEEIAQLHSVLGTVRADARLLYATTAGTLLKLNRSNALADYAHVAERIRTLIA